VDGIGVFCSNDVKKGELVYKFEWDFVLIISEGEIDEMLPHQQEMMRKYSYYGKGKDRLTDEVYFCTDDSRFLNHSDKPNLHCLDDCYFASCDISEHSELFCNYREFTEPGDIILNGIDS